MNRQPETPNQQPNAKVLYLMDKLIKKARQERAILRAQFPGLPVGTSVLHNYLALTAENEARLACLGESAVKIVGIEGLVQDPDPTSFAPWAYNPLQATSVEPLSEAPQPALRNPNTPLRYTEHLEQQTVVRPQLRVIQGDLAETQT